MQTLPTSDLHLPIEGLPKKNFQQFWVESTAPTPVATTTRMILWYASNHCARGGVTVLQGGEEEGEGKDTLCTIVMIMMDGDMAKMVCLFILVMHKPVQERTALSTSQKGCFYMVLLCAGKINKTIIVRGLGERPVRERGRERSDSRWMS